MKLRKNVLLCCVMTVTAIGCAQADSPKKAVAPKSGSVTKSAAAASEEPIRIDSNRAMQYLREIVAFGRRAPGSPGQAKQQAYLRAKLKQDNLEEDTFKA